MMTAEARSKTREALFIVCILSKRALHAPFCK
jgi:hypothetical protein